MNKNIILSVSENVVEQALDMKSVERSFKVNKFDLAKRINGELRNARRGKRQVCEVVQK